MAERVLPRYPIYVPSKGRYDVCLTARFLTRDRVPFYLVVEPHEYGEYAKRFPDASILVLPWSGDDEVRRRFCAERGIENGGLIAVRNWIKEHSISLGAERHWQVDDNIKQVMRMYRKKRIPCYSGAGFACVEDFADRYENIAIAGMNYSMFIGLRSEPPFYLNCRVYSCSLILNSIPHRWRIAYNDDTDICLQVLADGWCTALVNVFLAQKLRTMTVKGGNTDALYQGDGRLKMARSLERLWPGVVTTKRRFKRPQHQVYDSWRRFDTPLRLKAGISLDDLPADEYGLKLAMVKEVKSPELRKLLDVDAPAR